MNWQPLDHAELLQDQSRCPWCMKALEPVRVIQHVDAELLLACAITKLLERGESVEYLIKRLEDAATRTPQ